MNLDTLPGALRAFALELERITETGNWCDMVDRANASPYFAPPKACQCCGQPVQAAGKHFATPTIAAMEAISRLMACAAMAAKRQEASE